MNKILFRVDANSTIGWGHLYRQTSLAKNFQVMGKTIVFLLKYYSPEVVSFLENMNLKYLTFDNFILKNESDITSKLKGKIDIVFTDIIHDVYKNEVELRNHIDLFYKNFYTVSFIDFNTQNIESDLLILPYFKIKNNTSFNHKCIYGEKFFIIRDEFLKFDKKYIVKNETSKIVISMGSSNPCNSIEKAIEIISKTKFVGICDILIGNDARINNTLISNFTNHPHIKFNLINDFIFSDKIYSSDLVFTNSGLTKYETLFLGIPTIAFSYNDKHDELMNSFENQSKGLIYLGNLNSIKTESVVKKINNLIYNKKLRDKLSEAGKKMIDGKGSRRIINQITKNYTIR